VVKKGVDIYTYTSDTTVIWENWSTSLSTDAGGDIKEDGEICAESAIWGGSGIQVNSGIWAWDGIWYRDGI